MGKQVCNVPYILPTPPFRTWFLCLSLTSIYSNKTGKSSLFIAFSSVFHWLLSTFLIIYRFIFFIRWDEWVPKSRLRWAVDRNEVAQILPNDVVELWCCGANVPGAWLESRVKKVRNGRYCVGRVLSTGSLWVERDRLRLVKHVISIEGASQSPSLADPRSIPSIPTIISIDNSRRSLIDRIRGNNRMGCSLM